MDHPALQSEEEMIYPDCVNETLTGGKAAAHRWYAMETGLVASAGSPGSRFFSSSRSRAASQR